MSDIWRRKKLNSLRNRETAFYNDIKNFKASSNLNFNCNHCPKSPIFLPVFTIASISILVQLSFCSNFNIVPVFIFDPNSIFVQFSFLLEFRVWSSYHFCFNLQSFHFCSSFHIRQFSNLTSLVVILEYIFLQYIH